MNSELNGPVPLWRQITYKALLITAAIFAIYQLAYTQTLIQDPDGHLITHLGFAVLVVALALMLKAKNRREFTLAVVLLVLNLVVTGYLRIFLDPILEYRTAFPLPSDLVIGALAIIMLLLGCYLVFGKAFPIIASVAMLYVVVGRFLPDPFSVAPVSFTRLMMWFSIRLGTMEGIYGSILDISATYLFIFIFFGAVLHAVGGTQFIMAVGKWIGSKIKAGPAMTALVGSSLLGTITGSTVANITITGAFTIPMMKKAGYTPEQAAAIEAVSSNGGQIMPPIMGATAFVMAGYAGIPYIQIAAAAVIPALLYYITVFFYVYLNARKLNVIAVMEPISGRKLLLDAPLFFVPLGVLVFLLIKGFTLPFVGFWSIVSLVVVFLLSTFRQEIRQNFRGIIDSIADGVRTAAEMAMLTGLIGIVATAIKASGFGVKLPLMIEDLSGGVVLIALFIAMVSSILLGMGVPTTAAYLLVAIGAVPALLSMGIPLLQAHFFCFFFAIFSHLTPPVAIGSLVASRMAGANYWTTAKEAMKAGSTGLLLPYVIVFAPVVVLRPESGIVLGIIKVVAMLFAILSLQVVLSNYAIMDLKLRERVIFMLATVSLLGFVFTAIYSFLFAGAALFSLAFIGQYQSWRELRAAPGIAGT